MDPAEQASFDSRLDAMTQAMQVHRLSHRKKKSSQTLLVQQDPWGHASRWKDEGTRRSCACAFLSVFLS